MTLRCAQCHEPLPDNASFCIHCGALLQEPTEVRRPIGPVASGTTAHLQPPPASPGPLRSLTTPGQSALSKALIACVALGFATGESVAVALLITQNGWASWNLWPAALLTGGALLAENDWLNGAMRRGFYGLVCWAALPWFLVLQKDIAWLMLPALGWWLIWLYDRRP